MIADTAPALIPAALPMLNWPDGPCNSGFISRAPREETRSNTSAPASATLEITHRRFQCPSSCAAQGAVDAAKAAKRIANCEYPPSLVILLFDRLRASRTLVSL